MSDRNITEQLIEKLYEPDKIIAEHIKQRDKIEEQCVSGAPLPDDPIFNKIDIKYKQDLKAWYKSVLNLLSSLKSNNTYLYQFTNLSLPDDFPEPDFPLGAYIDAYRRALSEIINDLKKHPDKTTTFKLTPKDYDKVGRILRFGSNQIDFIQAKNQHLLLSTLFKNRISMNKKWDIFDLEEEWGESYAGAKTMKSLRWSVRNINDKISKATPGNINDFIEFKNNAVSINNKYL